MVQKSDDIDQRLQNIKQFANQKKQLPESIKTEERKDDSKWNAVIKILEEETIVEIYKKDGKYIIKAAMPINKWLLLSICINALLIAVLIVTTI